MEVKYPNIQVELLGCDSNSFAILGRCTQAMRRAKLSKEEIDAFRKEAMSGDADHLLQTCFRWFDIT